MRVGSAYIYKTEGVIKLLYSKAKKEALVNHESFVNKYNSTHANVQSKCELLYYARQQSVICIEKVEYLINSIANTPKEFERSLTIIEAERLRFRETEDYATEAYQTTIKSGVGIATGVSAGVAVATMTPTAAVWIATTFGTASTGTAISTLSGAAASKAALAWLGGGAIKAGGAGIVGGKALLALAGPIGLTVAGLAVAGSSFFHARKNKKIANEANKEIMEIAVAEAELKETGEIVFNIYNETMLLLDKIKEQSNYAEKLERKNYLSMPNDEQLLLGTLVNNTLSLAKILNKTVG